MRLEEKWKGDCLVGYLQSCQDMSLREDDVPTKWTVSRIKEIYVSQTKPCIFPFKAMCEHIRHAVQGSVPESGLSHCAILHALV